jgi:hypothetical protein
MHRILVANQPRVLRELLRRALEERRAQPGAGELRVAGEVDDLQSLPAEIERTGADRVIVSLESDGALPGPVTPLVRRFPGVRFLGVAGDGSRLAVQWQAHEELVNDPDLEALLGALDGPANKLNQGGIIH